MTILDLHWAAGMIEGEGCFYGLHGGVAFGMASTDHDVIMRLGRILGMKAHGPYQYTTNRQPYWKLQCERKRALGIALTFYSLLGARRQARIREILA